jgi:hypothetical protein
MPRYKYLPVTTVSRVGYGVPDPMITFNIIYFSSRSRIKKEIPGCEKLVLRIREHAAAHLVYPNN